MSFSGKVVMLTGAAGTGKSTLARHTASVLRPIHRVDFGQLLLDRKRLESGNAGISYSDLRRQSAGIISSEDVRAVDLELIASLPGLRSEGHVIIDSHAVTRETYGYRITHYSFDELRSIAFDAIVSTYCEPAELVRRHAEDSDGRPLISLFEAQHHMALQESLALQYGVACGCRVFMLNTTSREPLTLVSDVARIIHDVGGVLETTDGGGSSRS